MYVLVPPFLLVNKKEAFPTKPDAKVSKMKLRPLLCLGRRVLPSNSGVLDVTAAESKPMIEKPKSSLGLKPETKVLKDETK